PGAASAATGAGPAANGSGGRVRGLALSQAPRPPAASASAAPAIVTQTLKRPPPRRFAFFRTDYHPSLRPAATTPRFKPMTLPWDGFEVAERLRPDADGYDFDLRRTLDAVVGLEARVPEDAFTAVSLGTERKGNATVIGAGGLA